MEKKNIKAVELVRRIRDKEHKKLQGKSFEEIIEYYSQKSIAFRKKATRKVNRKNKVSSSKS